MNIGDLVHVHSSYNTTDDAGVKYSNVYTDISSPSVSRGVDLPRDKILVPLRTPGVLLEIISVQTRADFKWAKVMFPQGIGYVSLALLRTV